MDKVYKLKEIKLIGNHTDLIYCLIQLNDKRLASCSKERTIPLSQCLFLLCRCTGSCR